MNFSKILIVVITLVVISCSGSKSSEESEGYGVIFDQQTTNEIIMEIEEIMRSLPSPTDVPYLLMSTGCDYDPEFVNPIERIEDYSISTTKSALNLGIYSADIGYLISYQEVGAGLKYIDACQKLATTIGVEDAIDIELMERFQKNINNNDSLKILVDHTVNTLGERLTRLSRIDMVVLVLVGSYIEGLYISNRLILNYPEDLPVEIKYLTIEPIIKIIVEQKYTLDFILHIFDKLKLSDEGVKLKEQLLAIQTVYNGELSDVVESIKNNKGKLTLSPEILTNLNAEVVKVREYIVK